MKKIYIGTTNEGKIKEIKAAFANEEIELVPLAVDFDKLEDDLKETGTRDMAEISKAKARVAFQDILEKGGEILPVIVDDAGIYFEKLGDAPGIDSKSFVKEHGGIEGVKKLIAEGDRAYFQSVISYMDQSLSEPISFVGKVEGKLSAKDDAMEIEGGLPFNHVFIPDGYDEFVYKIPLEERANFGHRFKAAALLNEYLNKEIGKEIKLKIK